MDRTIKVLTDSLHSPVRQMVDTPLKSERGGLQTRHLHLPDADLLLALAEIR